MQQKQNKKNKISMRSEKEELKLWQYSDPFIHFSMFPLLLELILVLHLSKI